jgi:hypothetical protein
VTKAPDGPEWAHEIKYDGYRMHARLERELAAHHAAVLFGEDEWLTLLEVEISGLAACQSFEAAESRFSRVSTAAPPAPLPRRRGL